MAKIVAIGGGTGTPVILEGLKKNPAHQLSAVVTVTDSGGSTGRLRQEFGFLPVGDLRQCLVALADDQLSDELFDLLFYRFGGNGDLKGHNLGNLILTAFEDIKKSPGEAVAAVAKIFRVQGNIYPVTEDVADLMIEYDDGSRAVGEHILDDHTTGGKTIAQLTLSQESHLYQPVEKALLEADLIILGPGDLYGSLIPHSLVRGFNRALQQSSAKFVYITNLMTHFSQTHQMSANDHLNVIARYFERLPDYVIVNDGPISPELLRIYANEKEYPVVNNLPNNGSTKIIHGDFVDQVAIKLDSNDEVKRSLLRHDAGKLARSLEELI
ncbi:MAG: gluconeogenesis factor YvcK family protein [Candidatus Paceibacterota bacterium]